MLAKMSGIGDDVSEGISDGVSDGVRNDVDGLPLSALVDTSTEAPGHLYSINAFLA